MAVLLPRSSFHAILITIRRCCTGCNLVRGIKAHSSSCGSPYQRLVLLIPLNVWISCAWARHPNNVNLNRVSIPLFTSMTLRENHAEVFVGSATVLALAQRDAGMETMMIL
ncbi:hypothetical protein Vafri_4572 [Volvox africanus]|uniref:Uncharacterized protein n=1 Tax=Volvox africanus TaxID=51714 RepID=A0A8J4EWH9_9CHLO|nr:hypothetical protein Vafri_4572 [Volvox africanus]